MCCRPLAENTRRKNSPSVHHRTAMSGCIFATKVLYRQSKKVLNSNTFTCPHNMVNFDPLTAEIGWRVWSPQQISTGFASWLRSRSVLYQTLITALVVLARLDYGNATSNYLLSRLQSVTVAARSRDVVSVSMSRSRDGLET